jgi:hypothetical protein
MNETDFELGNLLETSERSWRSSSFERGIAVSTMADD